MVVAVGAVVVARAVHKDVVEVATKIKEDLECSTTSRPWEAMMAMSRLAAPLAAPTMAIVLQTPMSHMQRGFFKISSQTLEMDTISATTSLALSTWRRSSRS